MALQKPLIASLGKIKQLSSSDSLNVASVTGSSLTGGTLTLQSTSHATKGKILFGTSGYDEVNDRLGIGTNAPSDPLHIAVGSSYFKVNPAYTGGLLSQWFYSGVTDTRLYYDNITGYLSFRSGASTLQTLNVASLISGTISINQAINGGTTQYEAFRFAASNNYFQYYTEHQVAIRGGFGFAAGSADMQFRLNGAQTITGGTAVLRLGGGANGGIGVGITTTPTAKVHIAAGIAGVGGAPLKFTAGTLLTVLELGALEFTDDGTNGHLYITRNVAGVLTRTQIV